MVEMSEIATEVKKGVPTNLAITDVPLLVNLAHRARGLGMIVVDGEQIIVGFCSRPPTIVGAVRTAAGRDGRPSRALQR